MDHPRTTGASALFRQTLRSSLRFNARSSLTELLNYVLCVVLVHLSIGAALMVGVNYPAFAVAQDLLQVLYCIPVPALLARRLHDQDRRAGLLWLAAPGLLMWTLRKAFSLTEAAPARVVLDSHFWPVDLLAGMTSLALIITLLLPGTPGPNRFGPNPRQA